MSDRIESNNATGIPVKFKDMGDGTFAVPVSIAPSRASVTATIANGASVSGTVDLQNTALVGIVTPSAWTSAAWVIEVSTDGSAWSATPVLDEFGTQVGTWTSLTVNNYRAMPFAALVPWRYVRIRSGTSASPVNQGADRVFTLITRPLL